MPQDAGRLLLDDLAAAAAQHSAIAASPVPMTTAALLRHRRASRRRGSSGSSITSLSIGLARGSAASPRFEMSAGTTFATSAPNASPFASAAAAPPPPLPPPPHHRRRRSRDCDSGTRRSAAPLRPAKSPTTTVVTRADWMARAFLWGAPLLTLAAAIVLAMATESAVRAAQRHALEAVVASHCRQQATRLEFDLQTLVVDLPKVLRSYLVASVSLPNRGAIAAFGASLPQFAFARFNVAQRVAVADRAQWEQLHGTAISRYRSALFNDPPARDLFAHHGHHDHRQQESILIAVVPLYANASTSTMDPELPLSKSPILVPEYPPSVLGWDNDPNAAYWPILTSVPLTPGIDGLNLNSGVRVPAISTVAAPGSTAEVAATTVVVLAFPTLDEGSGSVRDRRRHGTGNDDDGTALVPGMLLFSHPADRAADNVTFMVTTVLDLRSYAHSTMQPAATRLRMQMSLSVSGMDVARSVHHERVVSRVDGHNETQLVAFRVADTTWTVACTPLESFVSQYFGGAPVVASHLASAAALVVAWLAYRAMDRMLALWKVESLLDAWRVSAEAVLAALPNPMILINKAGDIQGVNGPLLDLTGRSAVTEIASLDALVRVVATQCKDGTDALHTPPEDPSKTPHASVLNQVPQPPGISGTTASVQPSTSPSSSLTATLLGLSATRPSALTMSGALPAAATNTTMAAAAPSCELPRPAAPTCHQQQQAKPHFVHRYPSPALVRPSSTYPTPPEAARLDVHLVCAAPRTTIEMTAGVAPTPGHPHVSHVVVLTDVSEMRVRDRTLAATVRESARLHASQHHLLLYLAHELRNPLYVVQGWADDERSRIDHGDSDADGGVGAWKQLVLVESMIGSTVALLDGVVGAMHGAWVSESGQIAPRPHPSSVSPLPPPATTRSAASSHGHFSPSALPATFPYLRTDSIQSAPLAAEPRLGSPAVSPITDLSAFVAPPLAPSPPLLRPARQYLNPWRVVAR